MTTALLVARMGSSRLPGKPLRPILGRPMIERMFDRVAAARSIQRIVLATTDRPEDDPLSLWANRLGVECYRGPAEDVLARVCSAARSSHADPMVELLGDNPLVHSALIDDVVAFYQSGRFDYAATVTSEYPLAGPEVARFPIGLRVQVIRPAALFHCEQVATAPPYREHSTRYLIEHPELFRVGYFQATGEWAGLHRPEWTFAVNYPQNLDLVSRLFELCMPQDSNFTLQTVLRTFEQTPTLHSGMGAPREEVVKRCPSS